MPNPDGTHTETEHRHAIMGLFRENMARGLSADEAIVEAGKQWREALRKDGEAKIALVKAALRIS